MRKHSTSAHAEKHPYLRPELWANGKLVFWNTPNHNREKYQDFYNRQVEEAARLGKS